MKDFLPYQKVDGDCSFSKQYKFLRRKFLPSLRVVDSSHYLLEQELDFYLSRIEEFSDSCSYFLRFDVKRFYPSVEHDLLLDKISENYELLLERRKAVQGLDTPPTLERRLADKLPLLSRRFEKLLDKKLLEFFNSSVFSGQGLPIGSPLSYLLAGIFLLDLDLSFKRSYLRYSDDYLVFCKSEPEPKEVLEKKVIPSLKEHGLEVNVEKVQSGRIHKQPIKFLGFKFKAGHFTIQEERLKRFKSKVRKITDLRHKKEPEESIKKLNDKILGFGHYYKYASCKGDFKKLDAFIRKRLRRYITRSKSYEKLPNLTLTNKQLKQMGLKSLNGIKGSFDGEGGKSNKSSKTDAKSGKVSSEKKQRMTEPALQLQEKMVLEKLDNITTSLDELEKKMERFEGKLEQEELL